ncbi:ATP synthase F0 subunit C [Candidatus Sumerlaeota bacterium]|nr:ATP synthase F0 subunit C [Candidatus Sumerlaeota bacterium]
MIAALFILTAGAAFAQQAEHSASAAAGTVVPKAAAALAVGLAAIGSGFGLGRAVGSAMDAIGRQPEASGKVMGAMIVGAAFIEALTIYAFVVFILAPQ